MVGGKYPPACSSVGEYPPVARFLVCPWFFQRTKKNQRNKTKAPLKTALIASLSCVNMLYNSVL